MAQTGCMQNVDCHSTCLWPTCKKWGTFSRAKTGANHFQSVNTLHHDTSDHIRQYQPACRWLLDSCIVLGRCLSGSTDRHGPKPSSHQRRQLQHQGWSLWQLPYRHRTTCGMLTGSLMAIFHRMLFPRCSLLRCTTPASTKRPSSPPSVAACMRGRHASTALMVAPLQRSSCWRLIKGPS